MLHLIRHGATPLNVARVLQPADTPLSPRGQAQALALAERLRTLRLAGIIGRDLQVANTALSSVEVRPPHRVHTLACANHLRSTTGHEARSLVGA